MDEVNDDAKKERTADTHLPVGGLQYPAHISATGKVSDLTLLVLDGCFGVSVTPSTARALAEQLLARAGG